MFTFRRNLLLAPGTEMSAGELAATLAAPTKSALPGLSISTGPFAKPEIPASDDSGDNEEPAPAVIPGSGTSNDDRDADASDDEDEDYSDIDKMFKKDLVTDALKTADEKDAEKTANKDANAEEDDDKEPANSSYKLTTNAQGKKVVARDYSDIPEQDRALAKNMSGAAFDRFKAALRKEREATDLAKRIEELEADKTAFKSSLDHPDAYQLTPEYNQSVDAYALADAQVKHLQESLTQIALGNQFEPLGYQTDSQGNQRLVRFAAQPASAAAQAHITVQLQEALQQKSMAAEQIRTLPQRFQQERQRFSAGLNTLNAKGIDPIWNALENQEGAKLMQKRLLAEIPSIHRRNEFAEPYTKALTIIHMLAKQTVAQQRQASGKQFVNKERIAAGNVSASSGGARTGGKRVTTSDLYDDAEELFSDRLKR